MVLFTNFCVGFIAENYTADCTAENILHWNVKLSEGTLLVMVKI